MKCYSLERVTAIFLLLIAVVIPGITHAQESGQVSQEYLEKSIVLEASSSVTKLVAGTGVSEQSQEIKIKVLEGIDAGTITSFENDFTQLKVGDVFYVRHTVGGFDPETWSVSDPYRLNVLITVGVIFVFLLFIFGGIQGMRGLVSLLGSMVLIFYVLLPGIYGGYSPIFLSIGIASLIIILGSYVTHGFNRTTTTAMLGMIGTVIVTGIATFIVIHAANLSGYTSESNVYLNFNTDGKISMLGLLFGGIMIGLLGVLYDIAIGQAIAVEELFRTGSYTQKEVYTRAMRIGREHIGALVNTLAIAYVGVSLPLLLLFTNATTSIAYLINGEIFSTEIIRILMGSIGLILAVPITTLLASYMLHNKVVVSPDAKGDGHHHH